MKYKARISNMISQLKQKGLIIKKLFTPIVKEASCIAFGHDWKEASDDNKDEMSPGCVAKTRITCQRCGKVFKFKSKIKAGGRNEGKTE